MTDGFDNLRKLLADELKKLGKSNLGQVHDVIKGILENLVREGVLVLGHDHSLGGDALEYRVEQLFRALNLRVSKGRPGLEDFIVSADDESTPLVVEIKSSKSPSPTRSDLRQLDDWVFELSGEEVARKHGLPATYSNILEAEIFEGWSSPRHHPTPHKGMMVFNGSVKTPFEQRPRDWLGANEKEFAERRGFCVLSLECLISWAEACKENERISKEFCHKVQMTSGVLEPYTN